MKNHDNFIKDMFVRNKRELRNRWIGIVAMSFIFPILYTFGQFTFERFGWGFLLSFVQTAVFWNGTILVISLSNFFFPISRGINLAVGSMFLFVTIFVVSMALVIKWVLIVFFGFSFTRDESINIVLMSLFITYFISTFYAANYFFKNWRENEQKAELLERANLEARYESLKTQINPHFLFNSLNTLLTLVQDNEQASRYVENLSEFMRNLLQNQDKQAVLLRDELKLAQQYIFLQYNRFGNKLNINIDIPEKYYHYAVAPLAVQMLLENAMKHNIVSMEHPLFIKIYIENEMYIVVENNLQLKLDTVPSTGIGLTNIRNRYKFLNEKEIVVLNEKSNFIVKLPLFEVKL